MTNLRCYEDPCGIARALDLIGERWALLIVRELVFGPKRFTDLRNGLAHASPNVLSQRLRELEGGGVVRRREAGAATYELTDYGRKLHPILVQLGRWGAQSAPPPPGALSVDALLVALESTFVPNRAPEQARYELRLGEDRYTVDVAQKTLHIAIGRAKDPDAAIAADPATLRAVVFGGRDPDDAPIEIQGNRALARRFFRMFERPKLRTAK